MAGDRSSGLRLTLSCRSPTAATDRSTLVHSEVSTPSTVRSQPQRGRRLTSDMISFTTVDIPVSDAALLDMTDGADNSMQYFSHHPVTRTPYKIEPCATGVTTGVMPRPSGLVSGGNGTSNRRLPQSRNGRHQRPLHSRSRSGGAFSTTTTTPRTTTAGDRKYSSLSAASSVATMSGVLRDPLLNGFNGSTPPPSSGANGAGLLDATQRAATVWSLFMQNVLRNSNNPGVIALSGCDRHGRETKYSWVQYYEHVHSIARVLTHFQFARGDGAVICAKSSPEVHFLNLAVVALGGVVSHIRPSWSASELVDHIFVDCNASVLIIDELQENFVEALRRTKNQFRAVIVLREEPMDLVIALDTAVTILDMDDLTSLAKTVDDVVIELMVNDRVAAHACCLMAFAYDEAGKVRGISLSQDNVMFTAATIATSFGPLSSNDRLVGYIPLYHVAAQVLEIYMPMVCALSVVCAPSYNQPLIKVITKKKPTIFFATPDTWTHFSAQVYKAKSEVNAHLYRWAKTRATNNSKKLLFGQDAHRSLGYMLAKKLVLNNIKKRIGLESCHACYSVLAPLDFELEKLFKTIDIPIYQVFGCAETSGFAAINYPHAWEFGSSGRALKGTSITCDEVTQEVLLRGRNVFAGYVQNGPSSTPLLPPDRWFRFRQRGFLTPNGFLKISDPQEFVVLSTGDWIPVKPYEDALALSEPELDRVVLIGEARSFLSVLLFMKTTTNPAILRTVKTAGSPALHDDVLRVGKVIKSTATTVAEAIKCQAWAVHFDKVLEALPLRCGMSGFHVRKWILMADAFTVESGEIDPDTGAVRRKVVDGKYQSLLDSLYT